MEVQSMNRRIHGRRWLKIIFVVGLFLLPGLLLTPFFRKETFPPPEFSDRIFKLRQWTNKGWTGYPRKEERQLLDDLCGYVQAESNTVHREILYAQFTNELINVPFFSTNGVQRTNEFPRGWYQPPYRDRTMFYRSLVERTQERSLYTNLFDAFCLNLEMWKRFRREQKVCPKIVETWMTLRYEDCPRSWIEDDIRESLTILNEEGRDVERSLERSLERIFNREPDTYRRAYELVREVVGREAKLSP